MDILLSYSLRLAPAVVLIAVALLFVPRAASVVRLVLWILLFMVIRDGMTPAGLWNLGTPERFELVFISQPLLLIMLALGSLAMVLTMQRLEPELSRLVVWTRGSPVIGIAAGCVAGAALAGIALTLARPLAGQPFGELVPLAHAGVILLLSYTGNLYEELLFRGYLQGLLEQHTTAIRAALFSGIAFALGHSLLAVAVTDIGVAVLAFTLAEGLMCAFLRLRWGVIAATAAHGTAIGILALGW